MIPASGLVGINQGVGNQRPPMVGKIYSIKKIVRSCVNAFASIPTKLSGHKRETGRD